MRTFIYSLLILLMAASPSLATIRDAEIESVIRRMSIPLFQSAGLRHENVDIYLLNRPRINAFVAGGANIFIHSGLIEAADTPEMFLGVIAHEVGHIDGAHLSRLSQQTDTIMIGTILTSLLGIVAAIGGSGDAGAAIGSGGNTFFERNYLANIRINESAADQAAIRYLSENHISVLGIQKLFQTLERNERQRIGGETPEYMRSHPLTESRVQYVKDYIKEHPDQPHMSESVKTAYGRIRAKLLAFISPETITRYYPSFDTSIEARYARAIVAFKGSDFDGAISQMEALIKAHPEDGYFYDTYGQILFESGKIEEAIKAYEMSMKLEPNEPLIMSALAGALLHRDQKGDIQRAESLLEAATQQDKANASAWRDLARAYGKQNKLGLSYLSLAEEAALASNPKRIKEEAARAVMHLPENSAGFLRAKDLQKYAENLKKT